MAVGEVNIDEEGNATGSGLAFTIFTEILVGIDPVASRSVAARVAPFCEGLARAIDPLDGTGKLNLDGSNGPMTGPLDMGGYSLSNFDSDHGGPVALTGGAALATIRTYPTGLAENETLRVGCQVEIWQISDHSVYGSAVGEVSIRSNGSTLVLSRPDFGDKAGLPIDFNAEFSSSGLSLLVLARGNQYDCAASWKLWHQPKGTQVDP